MRKCGNRIEWTETAGKANSMTPLPQWIFLFGTMILYVVIGFVVYALYGRNPRGTGGGR